MKIYLQKKDIYTRISSTSPWKLVVISILASEVLTFFIAQAITLLFFDGLQRDHIIISAVAAFIVPLVVTLAIFRLIRIIAAVKFDLQIKDSAISSMTDGVVITDREGEIIYANPAFQKLCQISNPENLTGKNLALFWVSPTPLSKILSAIATDNTWKEEYVFSQKQKDNHPSHFVVNGNIIMDTAGKPLCVVFLFFDITQQKYAEEALQKANSDLQRFNKLFTDRELKMIELKKKIDDLNKENNVLKSHLDAFRAPT